MRLKRNTPIYSSKHVCHINFEMKFSLGRENMKPENKTLQKKKRRKLKIIIYIRWGGELKSF
jgi:hypothetical protein